MRVRTGRAFLLAFADIAKGSSQLTLPLCLIATQTDKVSSTPPSPSLIHGHELNTICSLLLRLCSWLQLQLQLSRNAMPGCRNEHCAAHEQTTCLASTTLSIHTCAAWCCLCCLVLSVLPGAVCAACALPGAVFQHVLAMQWLQCSSLLCMYLPSMLRQCSNCRRVALACYFSCRACMASLRLHQAGPYSFCLTI